MSVFPREAVELIARICPYDGAEYVERNTKGDVIAYGPIRTDWDEICERTAQWYITWIEDERKRLKPDLTHRELEMVRQRGLVKAIEFRIWLANATEPDGDRCMLKPLEKKATIAQEQSGDENDG